MKVESGVLDRATDTTKENAMEYGIWTENDDGFTEGQLHSLPAAKERLAEIIEESDDPERDAEDLSIREICSEHEGQPKNGCEECAIEDEEEEG